MEIEQIISIYHIDNRVRQSSTHTYMMKEERARERERKETCLSNILYTVVNMQINEIYFIFLLM